MVPWLINNNDEADLSPIHLGPFLCCRSSSFPSFFVLAPTYSHQQAPAIHLEGQEVSPYSLFVPEHYTSRQGKPN